VRAARALRQCRRFLASSLLLFSGCGESLPVAAVSGTIKLDGKALAGANITTQPISSESQNPGPGSFGHTDDQGHFELELVKPARKGAIIGEHRVMISRGTGEMAGTQPQQAADGSGEYWTDDPRSNRRPAVIGWPARYTDGSLHLTVPPEGIDNVNFDLSSQP
jgi:hypothetical protein